MDFLKQLGFDKEKTVKTTIEGCLENIAEELGCKATEVSILIKPTDEEFNFKCWIYQAINGSPKLVREISLKEILGDE